ncbi:MAG: TonB-dependent receptor [Reichenbachiella sp.]
MNSINQFVLFTLSIVVILGTDATAQEIPSALENDSKKLFNMSLEELLSSKVVTASKKEEFSNFAPGIISVITSEQIELFGARDLFDVLNYITGVLIVNTSMRNTVNIRGDRISADGNHVLVLLNDTPISREGYTGGLFNGIIFSAIPLEAIDQIEVIRGPGSVLYGTNAFAGVINIITKNNQENLIKASATAGSFGTYGVDLIGSTVTKNKTRFLGALSYYNTDGWLMEATGIDTVQFSSNNYVKNRLGVISRIDHKGFHIGLNLVGADRFQWNGNTSTSTTHLDVNKYMFDVGYIHEFGPNWSIEGKYSNVNSKINLQVTQIPGNPFFVYDFKDAIAEMTIKGQLFNKLNMLIGGTYNSMKGKTNTPIPEYNTMLKGMYFSFDYKLPSGIKFFGGGQYNNNGEGTSKFVPRFGAIYNHPQGFGVKALYGQAFRAPYTLELSADFLIIKGNPDLVPELATTFDFQLMVEKKNFQAYLTYFHTQQTDLIVRRPVDPIEEPEVYADHQNIFDNEGELTINGVEFESKFTPFKSLFLVGSYSYQINENEDGLKNYSLSPNHMVKVGLGYQNEWFRMGMFNNWVSAYYSNTHLVSTLPIFNQEPESFNDLSVNLTFDILKMINVNSEYDFKISLFAKNLLDQQMFVPQITPQLNTKPTTAGRGFYLTLSSSF